MCNSGRNQTLHALHWANALTGVASAKSRITGQTTIVLLHGLGDTADIWRPLIAHWRPSAPVIALDLPGHGRSPWLEPAAYNIPSIAAQVANTLDEHAIQHPLIIGHSLGAGICVELAARHPLHIQGSILIELSTTPSEDVNSAVSDHIDAIIEGSDTLGGLVALFLDRLPLADTNAVRAVVPAMATFSGTKWSVPLDPAIKCLVTPTANNDVWQLLSDLITPVGIIRGEYSAVLSRAGAVKVAASLPYRPVPIHEITMAGHAVLLEHPKALAQAIDTCIAAIMQPH